MGEFVAKEALLFTEAIMCGVIISVAYDFIRIFRSIIPHFNIIVGIEDFIFWNVSGIYMFGVMFSGNNGIVRGFFLFGAALGAYIYRKIMAYIIIILKKCINKVIMAISKEKENPHGKAGTGTKKSYKNQSYKQKKKV